MINLVIFGIVVFILIMGLITDWFNCWHTWEYVGTFGITFQQKKCKKCGKLKIVNQ